MRFSTALLASAAALTVSAQNGYKGFNYGANFMDGTPKTVNDFEYEFNAAKQLPGTNGDWTSARLYTMIQHGSTNTVIEAIQAAINTKTSLLLGLWASVPSEQFANEIAALKAAIAQYGTAFTDLVVGISVGSEDLYRITPTGIENKSGVGASPDQLIDYIRQTRSAIEGTTLAGAPVGHVDTWTAYVNGSNNGVISELDFLGMDAYPYFQTTMANSIENANETFYDAYDVTVAASQGKPVWVTETGWPVSGEQQNQAVASPENARTFWAETTCSLLKANINLFFYTLQDAQMGTPSPSFGIKPAGDLQQVQPLWDLSCPASAKPSSRTIPLSDPPPAPTTTGTTPISSITSTSTSIGPQLPVPTSLDEVFQIPQLLIPIDHSRPDTPLGSQFIGQLSPTYSTLVNFQFPASFAGKLCTFIFYMPPIANGWWSPYQLKSPGGLSVSRMLRPATVSTTPNNLGATQPIGAVYPLTLGQGHVVGSLPCDGGGQTVGFQISALAGLDFSWYQSVQPPVGLFVRANG
ncbi:glycoside hydrolase family 17 protein [Aaosphaeria arxii CBS 175.79]|uniref:Probable glucan endo-1,3-beta-glucosidase eglC n=1 Tax=Aaosphaeria arxii CBS 175.79 TaxID=1450172 RepID=A0A6A5XV56_9PLEO|nr:glycoside hydrolase family 17 protein [Aaosphaeria arxii CBS 175.79]KAF2016601.1 glycoside hydrolase family 17 protein [Aaosphaeria arxii CBS 175.79]